MMLLRLSDFNEDDFALGSIGRTGSGPAWFLESFQLAMCMILEVVPDFQQCSGSFGLFLLPRALLSLGKIRILWTVPDSPECS